jgi:hypothetical protein
MKAVSGSDWGHDKETLFLTYKALVESLFSFCVGIWFPNCKPSNIASLQIIQCGHALYDRMSYVVLGGAPLCRNQAVHEHLSMLCAKFLASCLCRCHPSDNVVQLPPGPHKNKHGHPLKETLSSRFLDIISPHLVDGIVPEASYERIQNEIHTTAVKNYIQSAPPNRVLGVCPPEVSKSEETLPQIYRRILAQLRDDRCSHLQTYQHFIKKANDDICPHCHLVPESVLFTSSLVPQIQLI